VREYKNVGDLQYMSVLYGSTLPLLYTLCFLLVSSISINVTLCAGLANMRARRLLGRPFKIKQVLDHYKGENSASEN